MVCTVADTPSKLPAFVAWPSFPFEGQLRTKRLDPPVAEEPAREGEDPSNCVACSAGKSFPLMPQTAAARARREARSAPRRDVSDMMDLLRSMLSLMRKVGGHD